MPESIAKHIAKELRMELDRQRDDEKIRLSRGLVNLILALMDLAVQRKGDLDALAAEEKDLDGPIREN